MTPTENQKAAPFFKFENLRIYHKSLMFSGAVLAICDNCITESEKMVARQLFEAAFAITQNIIEGSTAAKNTFADYLQQAKGSIRTCVAYTDLLQNRKTIDEAQATDIRNELMELTKMIGAFIVSLQNDNNIQ